MLSAFIKLVNNFLVNFYDKSGFLLSILPLNEGQSWLFGVVGRRCLLISKLVGKVLTIKGSSGIMLNGTMQYTNDLQRSVKPDTGGHLYLWGITN